MDIIRLTAADLALAASLVAALAVVSLKMQLAMAGRLVVAALRTTIQLFLVGLVLKALFESVHPGWMAAIAGLMLAVAGREIMSRQAHRFTGWWGFGVGSLSMAISGFSVTVLALVTIIQPDPWYTPRYAIPLLGMMLGNTMTGIAVSLDRLTEACRTQRHTIENRLMIGQTASQAIDDIRRTCIRSGLIPIVNSMAVAGLVSLPGMMTGQILAGNAPGDAVRYQILIMFLIAAGTGFGTITAVWLGARRIFDSRHRLRLDRLAGSPR